MDGALFAPQTHWFERQVLPAPCQRTIAQRIQPHLAPLHGAFNPMPAPAQMDDVGQRGPSQTPLMVDELAGTHGDEHDANEVRGARRQRANQSIHGTGDQVNWGRGQMTRGIGWFRHPPSISNLRPLLLLIW